MTVVVSGLFVNTAMVKAITEITTPTMKIL
jgi:hypothetical protein